MRITFQDIAFKTKFKVTAKCDNGEEIEDALIINMVSPPEVHFDVDRSLTINGLPVTVSWNVKNANKVELSGNVENSGVVESCGQKVVISGNDNLKFVLKVTDFTNQTKEHIVEVGQLSKPVMRLTCPTPTLMTELNTQIEFPNCEKHLTFEVPSVNFSIPELIGLRHNTNIQSNVSIQANVKSIAELPKIHLVQPNFKITTPSLWISLKDVMNRLFKR